MFEKIVVGADGSEASTDAIGFCARLAEATGAEVTVVHGIGLDVYPDLLTSMPALDDTWRKELLTTIESEWCTPLSDVGAKFQVRIIDEVGARAVMHVADEEDADLIVVGRRGRGGFKELLVGSVTHQLTHHARQPVLVTPPPRVS